MSQADFLDAVRVSVCLAKGRATDPTLPMAVSMGPMLTAETIVRAGYDPVVDFQQLAQTVLNDPACDQIGLAFLYLYAGLFDVPAPTALPMRAARIYQAVGNFEHVRIYSLAALAANFAADAYAQVGHRTGELIARHAYHLNTYRSIPWWPQWNAHAGMFGKWKLFRFALRTALTKMTWAAWGYLTDYWFSPWRTFLVGLVPLIGAGVMYAMLGVNVGGHEAHRVGLGLYLSGATVTTLGYGDVLPEGIGHVIAVAEALYGMLLFAFVTVLFARRYVG